MVANAAIVPAGIGGAINVLVNIGPTHVYIDINGYFADSPGNPANNFLFVNDAPGGATAIFRNISTSCEGPCGVRAETSSGHAIYGFASEASADANIGVFGETNSTGPGAGVYGIANTSDGGAEISSTSIQVGSASTEMPVSEESGGEPETRRTIPRESMDSTEDHLSAAASRLPAFAAKPRMLDTACWVLRPEPMQPSQVFTWTVRPPTA